MPTSKEIKQAREDAGLTVAEAASLIYKTERTWYRWEQGERNMDRAFWEFFKLRVEKDDNRVD